MKLLEDINPKIGEGVPYTSAWSKGWHQANLGGGIKKEEKKVDDNKVNEGAFRSYLHFEKQLENATDNFYAAAGEEEINKWDKISEDLNQKLVDLANTTAKHYKITPIQFVDQLNAYAETKGK